MAIFFIVLLGISIAGLVGILAVKRWELTGDRLLFAGVRPAAGRVLGQGLHFVERRAPAMLKGVSWMAYRKARHALNLAVAWTVLRAEVLLERVLHTLRHTTAERGEGEASAFLREVAEHKKSLLERSDKKPNAIYEE